jgi:hypothetical protein
MPRSSKSKALPPSSPSTVTETKNGEWEKPGHGSNNGHRRAVSAAVAPAGRRDRDRVYCLGVPGGRGCAGLRRAHILYQSGLAFDAQRSAGIGRLVSSSLKSTFLAFIIPLSVVAVLTIGLLGILVFVFLL